MESTDEGSVSGGEDDHMICLEDSDEDEIYYSDSDISDSSEDLE